MKILPLSMTDKLPLISKAFASKYEVLSLKKQMIEIPDWH